VPFLEDELSINTLSFGKLPTDLWGLHEKSEPYLFVTTLVYVAKCLLGVEKDDPLLVPALQFIRKQGEL
jgi:lanosterol synthase